MIQLEEPPTTLEQGKLKRTNPKLLVTSDLHQESKIELYRLKYNFKPQSSVFIYPARTILTPAKILELDLDSAFGEVEERLIMREFKDLSLEELSQHFLKTIKKSSLIPFMSHDYRLGETPIKEHSFPYSTAPFLLDIISELKQ